MSNYFVYKAAAGMLVFAASPVYCMYVLIHLGSSGAEVGSFDKQFEWRSEPKEKAPAYSPMPERLISVASSVQIPLGPRAVARKFSEWLDRE
ncbi:hypothetical protein AB1Y20_021159 [Prymnesium parvum]|uniref:Uncharacterized protein n=1 Tax=Prymnesium parvum TaxID=97485 RepID=A0AB34JLA0_PRYPA